MTHEEILKKAFEKAILNGFPKQSNFDNWDWKYMIKHSDEYFQTIFCHDFAKAFWEEKEFTEFLAGDVITPEYLERHKMPEWKIRLQAMVLEEDPIKYLEQFL